METQYWIQREGKTYGPYSGGKLKKLAGDGKIGTSDLISKDKQSWQVAGAVRGLSLCATVEPPQTASVAGAASPLEVSPRTGTASCSHNQQTSSSSQEQRIPPRPSHTKWVVIGITGVVVVGLVVTIATWLWTSRRNLILDLGEGATMELRLIPPGKFLMGSKFSATDTFNRYGGLEFLYPGMHPQREVTISEPFHMGIYEVTQAQWRAVMGTEPWDGKPDAKSGDSNAASYISWQDAIQFCEILSKRTGKKVSLPTEAQWEYACRAGSKAEYCFGDDESSLVDYAWYCVNAEEVGEKFAHPAGQKKPNAFGFYDMHGNVSEWCRDWYDVNFYTRAKDVDPENTTVGNRHVLRGGSWGCSDALCRAVHRSRFVPSYRSFISRIGFRVVVVSGSGVNSTDGTENTHKDADDHFRQAAAHSEAGRYNEAIAAYKRAIVLKPDFVDAYSCMGLAYFQLDQYVEAIIACKKAIAIEPNCFGAYVGMGMAYRKLEQYTESIAAWKKVIAIKPDNALAYYNLGFACVNLGQSSDAVAAFKKALAIKPDYAEAYFNMGVAYHQLKQYTEAITAWKKAISLKLNNPEVYYRMGSAYGKLARYAEALAAYKKYIAIKPNHAKVHCNMGIAYENLKQHVEAIIAYKKAVALRPDYALAYFYMGVAYQGLKQYTEAIAAYEKAIAIEPTGEMADSVREIIRRLRRQ
jgi:formylglycine-generating enzyme required for sulfatase activity/tetratricopeptide (TPR) repeat protein